jgi:hypothetical protein
MSDQPRCPTCGKYLATDCTGRQFCPTVTGWSCKIPRPARRRAIMMEGGFVWPSDWVTEPDV